MGRPPNPRPVAPKLPISAIDLTVPCIEWPYSRDTWNYGKVRKDGRNQMAHRVYYEESKGPIPDGFQVDHLCKNPGCINPLHLEAVTPAVNNERSDAPSAKNKRKTHCKWGHPLSGSNLRIRPSGNRECRECARQRTYAFYHKRPRPLDSRPGGWNSVRPTLAWMDQDEP